VTARSRCRMSAPRCRPRRRVISPLPPVRKSFAICRRSRLPLPPRRHTRRVVAGAAVEACVVGRRCRPGRRRRMRTGRASRARRRHQNVVLPLPHVERVSCPPAPVSSVVAVTAGRCCQSSPPPNIVSYARGALERVVAACPALPSHIGRRRCRRRASRLPSVRPSGCRLPLPRPSSASVASQLPQQAVVASCRRRACRCLSRR